jgi:hypothetical protein
MTDPTFLILYLVKRYGDQISAGIWPISTRQFAGERQSSRGRIYGPQIRG